MIKFEGTLSDKCVLYRSKYSTRIVIIGESLCLVIVCPLMLVLSIIFGESVREAVVLTAIMVIVLVALIIEYFREKEPRIRIAIVLTINSELIEYATPPFTVKPIKLPIAKVKKVIKVGQSYYVIRKRGDITNSIMAEEHLLTEGTIEEFEALFEGKMEVKN